MANNGFLAVSIVATVLSISFQESTALHCWTCSSDTSNGAFCNDNFNASDIPELSKRWAFAACANPTLSSSYAGRVACQKIKDRVGNRVVIRRRCAYVTGNEPKDACKYEPVSRSIQREFCEICDTDGCNGASQYGPAVLFVIVSAAITKWLSS